MQRRDERGSLISIQRLRTPGWGLVFQKLSASNPHPQYAGYLDEFIMKLESAGFIRIEETSEGRKIALTEKGRDFLIAYKKLEDSSRSGYETHHSSEKSNKMLASKSLPQDSKLIPTSGYLCSVSV